MLYPVEIQSQGTNVTLLVLVVQVNIEGKAYTRGLSIVWQDAVP